jgi:cytochrome P450
MEECRRRYGDSFTLKITHEGTWVFVSDPDAVKQVFTGDPRLLHAGEANIVLLPVLGSNSVLLLDDDAHMSQRKLMLPPFHGDRLKGYAGTIAEVARAELDRWPLGRPLRALPSMQALTLEVIMRTVVGVQDGERKERLGASLSDALRWSGDPRRMGLLAALGPKRVAHMKMFRRVLDPADSLVYDEIRARRNARDLEQREDIMTLLVAGHETTATSLTWALERLVRHPEMLERLRDGDDEYADAVVKETLRLRPTVSIVLRRLKEPMEIGGRLLPAGVDVAPCIYLMHRRADVYPDPLAFRPERFLEGQGGTYTWIPFGGGVRRCIGASFAQLEMRIVLQTLARRLELRPADTRPERPNRRAIFLTPARGGEIVAQTRAREPERDAVLAA